MYYVKSFCLLLCVLGFWSTKIHAEDVTSGFSKLAMFDRYGGSHACAIRMDGSVICWGSNSLGQLDVPSKVQGAADKIVVGNEHSCAISGEQLFCWGGNSAGQTNVPRDVQRWKDVTAAGDITCAVDSEDKLHCWGYYEFQARVSGVKEIHILGRAWSLEVCGTLSNQLKCWNNEGSSFVLEGNFSDLKYGGNFGMCALNSSPEFQRVQCFKISNGTIVVETPYWSLDGREIFSIRGTSNHGARENAICKVSRDNGRVLCMAESNTVQFPNVWNDLFDGTKFERSEYYSDIKSVSYGSASGDPALCAILKNNQIECRKLFVHNGVVRSSKRMVFPKDDVISMSFSKWAACMIRNGQGLDCDFWPYLNPNRADKNVYSLFEGLSRDFLEMTKSADEIFQVQVDPGRSVHPGSFWEDTWAACILVNSELICGYDEKVYPIATNVTSVTESYRSSGYYNSGFGYLCYVASGEVHCLNGKELPSGAVSDPSIVPDEIAAKKNVREVKLSADGDMACVVDVDSKTMCWRDLNQSPNSIVKPFPSLSGLTLSYDGSQACGITTNGRARCYDDNDNEDLRVPDLRKVAKLKMREDLVCALSDGRLTCWDLWDVGEKLGALKPPAFLTGITNFWFASSGDAICANSNQGNICWGILGH